MMPLFGRTQYLRGAVVLTLKHTFLSVGLVSFRVAVTTSVNGPEDEKKKCSDLSVRVSMWVNLHMSRSLGIDAVFVCHLGS